MSDMVATSDRVVAGSINQLMLIHPR
jgi:hypothetical protein